MTTTIPLAKITMKTIFGLGRGDDAKQYFQNLLKEKGATELMVIQGEMNGYGGKVAQFGENVYLTGEFQCINRLTSEIFESTKVYLPKSFTETVLAKFINRAANAETIDFAASFTLAEDKGGSTGYTFVATPIRDAQAVNKRAERIATLMSLPAPAAALTHQKKKAS